MDFTSSNLSERMANLCHSIDNLRHQPYVSLDQILKSNESVLGKLYDLFLSLKNKKSHLLLDTSIINDLIIKKTEGLIIKINQPTKQSMNFIEFMQQIEYLAKENEISKEYIYKKLLTETYSTNNSNQSNNALDPSLLTSNALLNEYNQDYSRLKTYFLTQSRKSQNESNCQMNCSVFIECICQKLSLYQISDRLQLNDIFYKTYSLFVNEGLSIPATFTIDFHGFLLCLKEIAQIFNLNLRILIKTLINP